MHNILYYIIIIIIANIYMHRNVLLQSFIELLQLYVAVSSGPEL